MTDEEETISISRGRKRKPDEETSEPVQNEIFIPIFPDIDRDSRHVVTKLDVYKLTGPNDGFKGSVPPNATLESIGRRFGDGRYTLHAVNQENRVLRRQTDVPISVNAGDSTPQSPSAAHVLASQHDRDAERVIALAKETTQQSREMTKQHLDMTAKQHEASITRDREFFQAQAKQQQDFFAGLLAFTTQSHQQSMASQQQMFQHTITMLEQGHQRTMQANDPATFLNIFRAGMESSPGSGDDQPFLKALQVGLGGLKEVKEIVQLRKSLPAAPEPSKLPVGASTAPAPVEAPARAENPSPNLIPKLLKLKKSLESKGVELEAYLDDVLSHIDNLPDEPEEEEDEEGENAPESPGGEESNRPAN